MVMSAMITVSMMIDEWRLTPGREWERVKHGKMPNGPFSPKYAPPPSPKYAPGGRRSLASILYTSKQYLQYRVGSYAHINIPKK